METSVTSLENCELLAIYVNSDNPENNLVYYHLQELNQLSKILSPKFDIDYFINKFSIVSKISANGDKIAYSEKINLFARQKND